MTVTRQVIAAAACAVTLLAGCEQRLPNNPKPADSPNPVEPQSLEEMAPLPDKTPAPKNRGRSIYPAGGYDGTPYRYEC